MPFEEDRYRLAVTPGTRSSSRGVRRAARSPHRHGARRPQRKGCGIGPRRGRPRHTRPGPRIRCARQGDGNSGRRGRFARPRRAARHLPADRRSRAVNRAVRVPPVHAGQRVSLPVGGRCAAGVRRTPRIAGTHRPDADRVSRQPPRSRETPWRPMRTARWSRSPRCCGRRRGITTWRGRARRPGPTGCPPRPPARTAPAVARDRDWPSRQRRRRRTNSPSIGAGLAADVGLAPAGKLSLPVKVPRRPGSARAAHTVDEPGAAAGQRPAGRERGNSRREAGRTGGEVDRRRDVPILIPPELPAPGTTWRSRRNC